MRSTYKKNTRAKILLRFVVVSICVSSCSASKEKAVTTASKETRIQPEFPIETLKENNLIAFSANYKRYYPRLLSYLLYNKHKEFNGKRGDFKNVKHITLNNFNIGVTYYRKYGKYKHSITVVLALSGTSKASLKHLPVIVESSKYGMFTKGELNRNKINRRQQRQLFVKPIALEDPVDVVDKLHNDVLTVTVGEQSYTFVSPEFDLNLVKSLK